MFQREHRLRKVMRLTYFASVVKMYQYSNGIDIAGVSADQPSNDLLSETDEHKKSPKSGLINQTAQNFAKKHKNQSSASGQAMAQIRLVQQPRKSESLRSIGPLSTMVQTTEASTTTPGANRKYEHDAFLDSSAFTSYKELLMQQSRHHKNSIDSTSAESPSRGANDRFMSANEDRLQDRLSNSKESIEDESP